MKKLLAALTILLVVAAGANAADWALSDPGADRILGWDDSATGAEVVWFTIGTGLSISATTISVGDLSATYQAADADLTTYAGITPSADVQTLLGYANFAAIKGGLSIDDLVTLSGVADGATTLGTFTGTTITDNQTIKAALQLLETAVEAAGSGTVTAGTYIDVSGTEVSVDFTETDNITWGAAAGGSQTWTFDTGAGTDPTMAIDETTGFTFNKPVVATSFSTGGSATPGILLQDSDNAAGTATIYGNSSGGANDIILSIGVEDSTGESTPYIEVDGVSETIDLLKPVVTSSTITATGAVLPAAANTHALGSATLEWSDLFLGDGAVINLGNDQDVTLTHVPDTGILLNAAMQLQFRDSAIYIHSANDGYLDIEADTAIRMLGPVDMGANALDCDSNTVTLSTVAGAINMGGATSLEIPNSDDPDVSVEGQVSFDTDGWMRVYSTSQKALARIQEEIHVTVYKPQDLDDAQRDHFWIWSNESGMSFIVTGWKGWSTSDDTTLTIYEEDADGANDATVDAVEIATGSGPYTGSDTTITGATIENGHLLYLDFDDTDAPAMVKITIYGYYNADVN